jgi:predicted enzyme related to lactoylglutathione lyase
MHKSRFCAFVIDCKTDDLDAAARFWSAALGRELEAPAADSLNYRNLKVRETDPLMLVQKVDHESRVHLDIETDDIEAEVARLEALGAKRVAKIKTWWVLEAPSGQRFCVVRPQRGALGADANVWP